MMRAQKLAGPTVGMWLIVTGVALAAFRVDLDTQIGEAFPDMVFEEPLMPDDYVRLGLASKEGPFRLSEVPGELLVIEFFNQYCATCQRQAPYMESFFRTVSSGDLADRVRVLTVGVGNRRKNLLEFREELSLSYPIVPDPLFERYMELGDPGGTPFTAFLLRREGTWILADFHLGMQGDTELLVRSRVMLEGRTDLGRFAGATADDRHHPPLGLDEEQQKARARAFLSRVGGAPVDVDFVDLSEEIRVYRSLGPDGKPTGLFARVASRDPVCDVCHAIHFLFAFDEKGKVRGFEPIHVTKYGNEVWSADDSRRLVVRLEGRDLAGLSFDPDVDAVASATMSSALIFDEVRRAAALLADLAKL